MRAESPVETAPAGSERIGALAGWGFGAAWAMWGLSAIDQSLARVITIVVVLMLGIGTLLVLQKTDWDAGDRSRVLAPGWQRRYNLLVLAEVVAIALVAATLGRLERPELIPMAICLIVGLHFLPLGSMFDMTAYRWTAAGLTTVALAGVALVPLEGADTARAGVGIAAALVLWATGIWLTRPQGNVVRGG